MFAGTRYPFHGDTDYEVLARPGVNHIDGFPPGSPDKWTSGLLKRAPKKVEAYGINVAMVVLVAGAKLEDNLSPNITLGISPDRDREIAVCQDIGRAVIQSIHALVS